MIRYVELIFQRRGNMIYTPSAGTKSWHAFLADPGKQWKTGYSAKALAYCWEEASGFPDEIQAIFNNYSAIVALMISSPP
jgi:hypothetical protein